MQQLTQPRARRRADWLYQQLDQLQPLRKAAHQALLAENRRHAAQRILCQIPGLGPTRTALIQAIVEPPHRFRSKRQFWTYVGLAVVIHSSADYRVVEGQVRRSNKLVAGNRFQFDHDPEAALSLGCQVGAGFQEKSPAAAAGEVCS